MKHLISILFFVCGLATAQVNPPVTWSTSRTAPSGTCPQGRGVVTIPGGIVYTCQNGAWTQISGGGGSSLAPFTTDGTNVTLPSGTLSVGNTVADPTGQTMVMNGTPGSTVYTYAIVARVGTTVSNPVFTSTYTGNLTLSGTNYNAIGCTSVSGVVYDVYRIASNGLSTGGSLGKVGAGLATCALSDTGIAGDGTVPAAVTTSGGYSAHSPISTFGLSTLSNVGVVKPGPFHAFMQACGEGNSTALQVIGDSTGADAWKWPLLLTNWLAWNFPTCAVRYHLWDDTTQTYDAAVLISAGTSGERYISFDGLGEDISQDPAQLAAAFDGTKDLELRADIQPTYWSGTAQIQVLHARWDSANHQTYFYIHQTSGAPIYAFNNGSSDVFNVCSAALPTGTPRIMVRVTHQLNDGSGHNVVKFYTSVNRGATWTQLGNTITNTGAVTINVPAGANVYRVGGTTISNRFTGRIYGFEIWQNGAPINPLNLESYYIASTHEVLAGSPTIDVMNGSKSGANLAYYTGKQGVMFWPYQQSVFILNDSHNETNTIGATNWTGAVGTYIATVKPYLPAANIAILTQNPKLPGASYLWYHEERLRELRGWAQYTGYSLIDTEEAFLLDPRGLAALIESDKIHPNGVAGGPLEFSVIRDVLLQSR